MNKGIKDNFFEAVEKCNSAKEVAKMLNATETYICILSKRFGVNKFRNKNRKHTRFKTEKRICQECGEMFVRLVINNNPARFCSKKCQGRWLGRNYGLRVNRKNICTLREKE